MIALLVLVALAAFVVGGIGVALVRAEPRSPVAGGAAWFATLTGRRLTGAALATGAALVLVVVLAVRP